MSRYFRRSSHLGERTVRFIPVKDGDVVELGDVGERASSFSPPPYHTLLGFKPGTPAQPRGWIVVLVNEHAPKASKPVKRRPKRHLAAVS